MQTIRTVPHRSSPPQVSGKKHQGLQFSKAAQRSAPHRTTNTITNTSIVLVTNTNISIVCTISCNYTNEHIEYNSSSLWPVAHKQSSKRFQSVNSSNAISACPSPSHSLYLSLMLLLSFMVLINIRIIIITRLPMIINDVAHLVILMFNGTAALPQQQHHHHNHHRRYHVIVLITMNVMMMFAPVLCLQRIPLYEETC